MSDPPEAFGIDGQELASQMISSSNSNNTVNQGQPLPLVIAKRIKTNYAIYVAVASAWYAGLYLNGAAGLLGSCYYIHSVKVLMKG